MTSLKRISFLIVLLLLGTSRQLWADPASGANAQKRDRIVILGDSITAGYGLEPSKAYPALLQARLDAAGRPFEVINAGVSGDTTAGGLRRVDWALKGGARVLIVALGGNDGLRGLAPKQTAQNLSALIERARAKVPGLLVIVAGMQMPANLGADYVAEFNGLFKNVATQTGARLVPFLLEGVGGDPALNQPDLIHPTAEGQKRVADNVWRVLEAVLPG